MDLHDKILFGSLSVLIVCVTVIAACFTVEIARRVFYASPSTLCCPEQAASVAHGPMPRVISLNNRPLVIP